MFLLVDFGKVLCSSANERQQNSNATREDYIPQILAVLLDSWRLHLTFAAFCLLFVADVPPRETSLSDDERGETSAIRRLYHG